MKRAIIERITEEIRRATKVLLTTHTGPDGDGLGSEIALARYLRSLGKNTVILNPDPTPERYRFLDPEGEVGVFEPRSGPAQVRNADLIFVLDNSSLGRLGNMEEHLRGAGGVHICIDHHSTTDGFWQVNLVDESACATGEMIFELLEELGAEIDIVSAVGLYTALITDTGHFRFSKTSPRSHRVAAALLAKGVKPAQVYQEVFERHGEGFIRLMGTALANSRLEAEGGLAWIALSRAQIQECGVEDVDTSEIVNHLFSIDGVRIALLFKELSDSKIKVSLRSKGEVDIHQVATRYGGGGHLNASGAVLDGPLDDAVRRMVTDATRLLS